MPYKEVCLALEDVEDYDFLRFFTLLSSTVIVLRIFTNVMMEKGIAA